MVWGVLIAKKYELDACWLTQLPCILNFKFKYSYGLRVVKVAQRGCHECKQNLGRSNNMIDNMLWNIMGIF